VSRGVICESGEGNAGKVITAEPVSNSSRNEVVLVQRGSRISSKVGSIWICKRTNARVFESQPFGMSANPGLDEERLQRQRTAGKR
jgi:hypothetical protein